MKVAYLNRIGYFKKEIPLNEFSLNELHQKHVLNIPFEDIDIHTKEAILLNFQSIFDKVINRNRGGFCYELNYLFYKLLVEIGFKVKMVSTKIYDKNGILGPEFDHISLIVSLKEDWLLDVGFGDLFMSPIKIKHQHITKDWFKFYKIDTLEKGKFLLLESKDGKAFIKKYEFTTEERKIEDFKHQSQLKQNSEDSYFVKNLICTLPNPKGRITIFNNKLIETIDGTKKETEIKGALELTSILRDKFNIQIEKNKLPNKM